MKILKLLAIIAAICFDVFGMAAEQPYTFHHLNTGDGLSNNSAKALLRDSYGFLWIGTEFGLNRYDGYGFKTFLADPNAPNRLHENNIKGLSEDGMGNIWIDLGYNYAVYNREKDNFIQDKDVLSRKFNIRVKGNPKIYVDKKKDLLVIDGHEIYYYEFKYRNLKIFKYRNLNLSNIAISDDKDHLYVVDAKGLFWQIRKKSGRLTQISIPTDQAKKRVQVFADSGGGVWLFSSKDEYVYYKPANSSRWEKIELNSVVKSQNTIVSIVEGDNNQIWIATDHKGLFVCDKSDKTLANIISNPLSQSSIASNNVSSILIDNTGTVWVGHDKKGISFFNKSFQNFANVQYDQCRDISRILELRNGDMLFGTDGNGLFRKSRNKSDVVKLPIPNIAITSLLEDKKGSVWIGTYQQGLYRFGQNKLSHFTTTNSNLSSDDIWSLAEDRYGNIWIGPLVGKIQKHASNNTSNVFETVSSDNKSVSDMTYDGLENVYAATVYGLMSIDVNNNKSQVRLGNRKGTQQFKQQQLFNIYKDSRNLFWIGSNAGLSIWDAKKDTLHYFGISEGLSDNIIRGITEDNFHNIWVTTTNGLSVLSIGKDGDKIKIINSKNFSVKDGLKSNYFNHHSICKLQNGNILAGTTEGYTIIDPGRVTERKHPMSKIYFTRINIGDTQIYVDSVYNGHVVLDKSIEQIESLDLKYNDKLITLEFTTSDLINADKVKYLYKIEGFNSKWVATKKNEINITSLPAGRYQLQIKACNSDGVWNNESKSLIINVAPPFYLSFWAILLYALMLIGLVLIIIHRGQRRHQLKLEEQRREMSHEHELRINDMKLRFFTNISHDLRTPLTLIITPLQALLKDTVDESLKKKLEVMFKNAQQLMSLINSLLDFRKLDVGAEMLHLKPGNIIDMLDEIYASFDVYATERKIKFLLSKSVESLWLEYDHDKIQKSIVNLLSNAFKYTPDGGEIKLGLYTHESDLCISVSDSGIGISEEDKSLIFNRFYQIERNLTTTGSGIGLHIVSEYIKLHHGTIDIADNQPNGSVFTLRFPILEAENIVNDDESEFVEEIDDEPRGMIPPAKPVVLFVDDNHDLCEFIHDNLKDDYSLLIANDGQEAIALLKQKDVNVVVSDVMMPVMDGIELCRQIKTNIDWSHIPVILLTARTADEHKVEGLELGADDYITKPFNLDILKLRISKFIEWSLKSHNAFKHKMEVSPSEITITPLDEKLIEKAIVAVEKHMGNTEFSVEMLGDALGLSRGHLYKKLMAITGKGPAEFIRTIRLKRGKQLLEKSQMQIGEIAYELGFSSPRRFTINFKEEYGISPSEYQKQCENKENEPMDT